MKNHLLHHTPSTSCFVEQSLNHLEQAQSTPNLQHFMHKTYRIALLSVSSLAIAKMQHPPLNWNFNKFQQRYEPTLAEAIVKLQELSQPSRLDISALINF